MWAMKAAFEGAASAVGAKLVTSAVDPQTPAADAASSADAPASTEVVPGVQVSIDANKFRNTLLFYASWVKSAAATAGSVIHQGVYGQQVPAEDRLTLSTERNPATLKTLEGFRHLTGATITYATLDGGDYSHRDFTKANLAHSSFRKSNLSHVNISGTEVTETVFDNAIMVGAYRAEGGQLLHGHALKTHLQQHYKASMEDTLFTITEVVGRLALKKEHYEKNPKEAANISPDDLRHLQMLLQVTYDSECLHKSEAVPHGNDAAVHTEQAYRKECELTPQERASVGTYKESLYKLFPALKLEGERYQQQLEESAQGKLLEGVSSITVGVDHNSPEAASNERADNAASSSVVPTAPVATEISASAAKTDGADVSALTPPPASPPANDSHVAKLGAEGTSLQAETFVERTGGIGRGDSGRGAVTNGEAGRGRGTSRGRGGK